MSESPIKASEAMAEFEKLYQECLERNGEDSEPCMDAYCVTAEAELLDTEDVQALLRLARYLKLSRVASSEDQLVLSSADYLLERVCDFLSHHQIKIVKH